jgi:dihydrofolate synthase / folylpolyglutamate synthase
VVLAMMADKDHEGFYRALEKEVDFWYIAHFELPRCMPSIALAEKLKTLSGSSAAGSSGTPVFQAFATVPQAFDSACGDASGKDIIVVAGSFVTVAEIMAVLASDFGQRN